MKKAFAAITVLCLLLLPGAASARDFNTVRVSVSNQGVEGNGDSFGASISTNGRWVAFWSRANNLVRDDRNEEFDIYVHDLRTRQTKRVSVSSSRVEANGGSRQPSISANGKRVVFVSDATNLVADDQNSQSDIFLRDLRTGQTSLVSVDDFGQQANGSSDAPSISANGRWVVFESSADNLVPGDTVGSPDIFVRNLRSGKTQLVSVNTSGKPANAPSFLPSWGRTISPNGHLVVFTSVATNLAHEDRNGVSDIFVHNLRTGRTSRVSVSSSGEPADLSSNYGVMSGRRRVAFCSWASNLVPNDNDGGSDVFVHNLERHTTEKVSVTSKGQDIADDGGSSCYPSISPNGRWVSFLSYLSDGNNRFDVVFVHDIVTGKTTMMTNIFGQMTNLASQPGDLSNRSVAFDTDADNLVPGGDIYLDANDVFVHYLRGRT